MDTVNKPLMKFKAVFPLQLFPDEVILDRFKINIIKKDFILSERVTTIPLSAEVGIKVNKGPFFSQIEIKDVSTIQGVVEVRYIRNKDAYQFRQIVEGIVVGIKQGVDLMSMTSAELLNATRNWGSIDVSQD